MNEMTISRFTAAELIKEYYEYHYFDLVNVKVKPKLEGNDLCMKVKIISVLNHKRLVENITLNQGQITTLLNDYMEINYCKIHKITFEPYFHNINIKYSGEIENLKSMKPVTNMQRVYSS